MSPGYWLLWLLLTVITWFRENTPAYRADSLTPDMAGES